MARGCHNEILEIPPATLRLGGVNVPVGGGGYFRLLPFPLTKLALSLSRRDPRTGATVLYFHPWEFDPDQPRLPLKRLSRFRTYVGIRHSQRRLTRLLSGYSFVRAVDLARRLQERRDDVASILSGNLSKGENSKSGLVIVLIEVLLMSRDDDSDVSLPAKRGQSSSGGIRFFAP